MDSVSVGQISELRFAARLIECGYEVSFTLANRRYDMVAYKESKSYRVQVKTGYMQSGSIAFDTKTKKRNYEGQIEYFGVYWPSSDSYYLIPAHGLTKRSGFLHFSRPRRVTATTLYAHEYELKAA